jgi:hypothetical protein
MPKLTFEYVKNYIEESGDQLISENYISSKKSLEIECSYCDEIFSCSFVNYQQGRRHTDCPNKDERSEEYEDLRKPRTDKVKKATEEIPCAFCSKIFKQKYSKQKVCNVECSKGLNSSRKGTGHFEKIGRMGGIASAKVQVRRSYNEMYFSELCKKVFKDDVLTNETIFDGWDCDVIIQDLKIAVSWAGIWHYKQVRSDHNLEQVQRRDNIKDSIIKKYGYYHYIIKDMGRKSKKFVIEEFNKFIDFVNKEYNYNIALDNYEVDMSDYNNHKVIKKKKKEKKCIDCDKEITKEAERCIDCNRIKSRKCERPSLETLLKEIEELGYVGTGNKYSVTDNSIRKWVKNYQKVIN